MTHFLVRPERSGDIPPGDVFTLDVGDVQCLTNRQKSTLFLDLPCLAGRPFLFVILCFLKGEESKFKETTSAVLNFTVRYSFVFE